MDKLFLNGLSVECIIGIWEWERRVKQTVILDLEFATDVARAAASDRVEDAIDYKQVADRLTEFVAASNYNLIETLAENAAQFLLREFGMTWLRLSLRKPGALSQSRMLGVVVERTSV